MHLTGLVESKLVLGVLIILMNIGSKYVVQDVPPIVNIALQHWAIKALVLFAILYVSLRDLEVSLMLTLAFIILFRHLLHQDSPYCILPETIIQLDQNNDSRIDAEEIKRAEAVLEKYRRKLQGG